MLPNRTCSDTATGNEEYIANKPAARVGPELCGFPCVSLEEKINNNCVQCENMAEFSAVLNLLQVHKSWAPGCCGG
jgi:hypothetical protein